jgi:hypothetical protein
MNADTYRTAFLGFLDQGMTAGEALEQFDREDWNKAVTDELESHSVRINPTTFGLQTDDGKPALCELSAMACRDRMNDRDMGLAAELWLKGWTSENPHGHPRDVFAWFWRRPPKRPGKLGRKYLSTQQAYNAMKKEC